ncbi:MULTISPECIES: hypothetical protein [Rhodococcus]|uniref:Uncharacterized protein n=3 Tax=Rhodococcus TaxID=1827 RepID=V9XK46_9NOCA|nr:MULTISPECIES: hypothetical protein [Rhodococcus]AHD23821.1 hypothetical protein Y013_15960 [Rhodococcus pyridinivorans SB3094]MBX4168757.1 hypothetical protein [Rhodococcus sp. DMU2021]MCT7293514.1 hypothetical protein [Rhodococcus sp. PAE-6]QOV98791.1 hypothetical protein INP59_23875 [Rhodococcus pyridinivorans]UPK62164.1 hypothetical protein MYP14_15175 [Rhodococcus pyridinivorans]
MNSHFFLPRTVATEWIKLHLDRMYAPTSADRPERDTTVGDTRPNTSTEPH